MIIIVYHYPNPDGSLLAPVTLFKTSTPALRDHLGQVGLGLKMKRSAISYLLPDAVRGYGDAVGSTNP